MRKSLHGELDRRHGQAGEAGVPIAEILLRHMRSVTFCVAAVTSWLLAFTMFGVALWATASAVVTLGFVIVVMIGPRALFMIRQVVESVINRFRAA